MELFKKSNKILIITGAGISADSGIPIYRGETKVSLNEIKESILKSEPNEGHRSLDSLVDILRSKGKEVLVATQNIDSFHKGLQLHGSCGVGKVTHFGEPINPEILETVSTFFASCDLLVFIGTSGSVQPWCILPKVAKETAIPFIYINKDQTVLSQYATVEINENSTKVLKDFLLEMSNGVLG